jgi:methionine biosynthesis protein MetW
LSNGIYPDGSTESPDNCSAGFIADVLDPLRYDGQLLDPDEVTGIFASVISPGSRVLDVGCGTGSVSKILVDTCGINVVGVEPDPVRAARAISRGLKVHVGYLSPELIRTEGPFDVVLFADVLEHLPDPHSMLVAARAALRPGGSVVLSVPNVAHWTVRVDILRGRFIYKPSGIMDATHLRWFTADNLKSLVTSAGFAVIYYRAAAGTTLSDNVLRRPLSWFPEGLRSRLLRSASRHWPTLFGCQHVIKAEIR